MDTHANVLRWRENAFRRDRVEPSSWVIDGHHKGLNSEILSRQNTSTKRCLNHRASENNIKLHLWKSVRALDCLLSTLSTLSHHG